MALRKLGLYGLPGAGKGTTSLLMENYCVQNGFYFSRIKLAEPLYEAQSAIYRVAGREIRGFYDQDGELLNFLGYYLRKLNPNVLLGRFSEALQASVERFHASNCQIGLIACDDVRAPDAKFLVNKGFELVQIVAPVEICEQRRRARGDLSLGSSTHITELGMETIIPVHRIVNDMTIEQLSQNVMTLLERLLK